MKVRTPLSGCLRGVAVQAVWRLVLPLPDGVEFLASNPLIFIAGGWSGR